MVTTQPSESADSVSVAFNPFEPGFTADPYPQYRALREHEPVHLSPFGNWLLSRHDDVVRFLRDHSLSVEDRNAANMPLVEYQRELIGERAQRGRYAMLNRDPPDHTRLRRLVTKAFTPRAIESLRPHVQELVDEALTRVEHTDEVDVIADLAFPLPFTVISEMLGMPDTDTDADQLRHWSGLLVRTLEPLYDLELIQAIAEAGDSMRAFVSDAIAWKRRTPADDMLSALIAAEDDGDVLSDEELLEQVLLLYIAGHETTVNLIGNGVLALLRHRHQLERLQADPTIDANAVEELLRYDSPVQMSRRITLDDVDVNGHQLPAGSFVVLILASANRDPDHWGPTADELDLARDGASHHASFGGGGHYCLGAALARMEGQVVVGTLVRRFPRLDLAGEPTWNGRINLRGLSTLPVTLTG
ncbi:MAG: cytochrome P450 [Acidimicrobiales bacterium]